ncbi:MAG: hypothetical protein GJ680_07485 [Alteromonadaceae bacterium]|nr:hypothetical protein [Alteromonadaceae bacterium]
MNEIIEYIAWAFREKPMFATLVCAVFSFINLLIAFHFLKKAKGQRMAMFLVENQFNSVSQADIETHFFGRATGEQLTES